MIQCVILCMVCTCMTAMATLPPMLFSIGQEDHSPAEFALGNGYGWQQYAQTIKDDVCFRVGESHPQQAWPYIHPNVYDRWAGAREHPFRIHFTLREKPDRPLTLVIAHVNTLARPLLEVRLNGDGYVKQCTMPEGSGDASGSAEGVFAPARTLIPLPAEAFRVGDNELVLTLKMTSWIIYDAVMLCREVPPVYTPPTIAERVGELQRGEWGSFDEIVFATRSYANDGHWYANFSYWCFSPEQVNYGREGRLCAYNIHTGALRVLIDDPCGALRDPCVSYDAKKILFSYRKGSSPTYHLYEIDADGKNLRPLTDGIYDDIEPCYLPDGGIAFSSARARRWVNCWLTQVATLNRCDGDGQHIRPLSANIEQDNTPWPLPDGRILFMRWEYVDRSQVNYHHLWTMNPDGTQHNVFFGNLHPGGLYIDAKPIPHTSDVVFIDSPGHGSIEHRGYVARVSAKAGPDEKRNLIHISTSNHFRDPWAFENNLFMAARERDVVLLDNRGRQHTLFSLPTGFTNCIVHEPRPILARAREQVIADKTDWSQKTGTFLLENVYEGRQMVGVERGTIKQLLVLESLPKPINFTGGMDPLSYVGTFTLPRVLGTVPVEEDGSAYFKAPALRALFFVALDARGRSVKRMQSFTQVMPGEVLGCTGCHEARTMAPRPPIAGRQVLAARKPPHAINGEQRAFDVPDFPRHVQPILDRHCVRCHNPDERKGGVDLCGDHGPMFSMGYYGLVVFGQIADGRNYAKSNYAPYTLGSGGSTLMKKIDGSHHDVHVAPEEEAALRLWLDASAPYPGTYAALGTGSIGGYIKNEQVLNNDAAWPTTRAAQAAFERRCAQCHGAKGHALPRYLSDENGLSFWMPDMSDARLKRSRHALFNLTRPEKSYFLRAPLSVAAGGFGRCTSAQHRAVFESTDDPDYRCLLAMIEAGRETLNRIKRFDMIGFRPREEYLRELKRYGILPATFDLAKDPVDPYRVDRQYWDSFVY